MTFRQKGMEWNQKKKSRSAKKLVPKLEQISGASEEFNNPPVPELIYSDILSQMKQVQSVQNMLRRDRRRLPNLKDPWTNTRDISHLKDIRDLPLSPSVLSLPTDLPGLVSYSNAPILPSACSRHQCERLSTPASPHRTDRQFEGIERLILGNPTGRQDIENLTKWLSMMTEKHMKDKEDTIEHFEKCELIYKVCIGEIIRQVAVQCVERGKLLKEVLECVEQIRTDKQSKLKEQLEESLQRMTKERDEIKKKFRQAANEHESLTVNLYDKISEYVKDNNDQKEALNKAYRDLDILKENYKDLKKRFDFNSKAYEILMGTLDTQKVTVNNKFVNFIKKNTLPLVTSIAQSLNLESTRSPEDLDEDLEIELNLQTEELVKLHADATTQTEKLFYLKDRYSYKYLPHKEIEFNHSFDGHDDLSDYELIDHYNSFVRREPKTLYDLKLSLISHKIYDSIEKTADFSNPIVVQNSNIETLIERTGEDFTNALNYQSQDSGVSSNSNSMAGLTRENTKLYNFNLEEMPIIEKVEISELKKRKRSNRVRLLAEENDKDSIEEEQPRVKKNRRSETINGIDLETEMIYINHCYTTECSIEELSDDSSDEEDKGPYQRGKSLKLNRRMNSRFQCSNSRRFSFRKRPTKFMEFKLNIRKDTNNNNTSNKKNSPGTLILQNLCRNSLAKLKKKGTMSGRAINRLISTVYHICITKKKTEEVKALVDIMYDEFYNRYGLKSVADRKFNELICSLFKLPQGRRKMYLRFIGAGNKINTSNYSQKSFKLFLSAYHFMLSAKVGINVHTDEYSDHVLIPTIRANECIKEKLESKIGKNELTEIYSWVQNNSLPDKKKINKGGLVSMDRFLIQFVEAYEKYLGYFYEAVLALFRAVSEESTVINLLELEMFLRFANSKKGRDEDSELEFSPHETFDFLAVYDLCVDKSLISFKDAKRILKVKDDPRQRIKVEKNELREIIRWMKIHYDEKWRTLKPFVFESKLYWIEESLDDDYEDSRLALGWSVFSYEIRRIKEEYHAFNN